MATTPLSHRLAQSHCVSGAYSLCYESDGPMRLAAALKGARAGAGDAAASDCLQQAAPGPDQLKSPEPNFYVLGSKSYGRDPSFLLRTGHQQVEAVVSLLKQALLESDEATATGAKSQGPVKEIATDEEAAAAVKIQASVRGRQARASLQKSE